ncbi:MAG: hypothetical protein JXC31_04325, partial [Acholeplasmataceae bacterium]|nr:hypothetical protein [Acholeplasmataceae bacterium]
MEKIEELNIKVGNAICYSGYRQGQSPALGKYPTYQQIKEDLMLLNKNWDYIRIYDASEHARTVLEVIKNEKIDVKVMIGVCLEAEINNSQCPWGGIYSDEQLEKNKRTNKNDMQTLINLADQFQDIVFSVSAGNEATAEWTDHLVPVESVIEYVRTLKKGIKQPVTYCENYIPWQWKLSSLVDEVDFISLHTYPIWEYKSIDEAVNFTIQNYYSVKNRYPNKFVIITEAGWTTKSNGHGFPQYNANEQYQEIYYENLLKWSNQENILSFIFEAFDEEWKGSSDPMEPEKHWGLFTIERKSKRVMKKIPHYANI